MRYYFAPMEGITGYVFRGAHHRYFPGVDKYFSPFIAPNQNRSFSPREKRDVLPENNEGVKLVPQILTAKAEDFMKAALEFHHSGRRRAGEGYQADDNRELRFDKGNIKYAV